MMVNKKEFAKIMFGLGEIYDKQITEFVADTYYNIFKDYDLSIIQQAVRKVVESHKYNTLPKPADILEYLVGSRDDKALVAWLQVKEAIQKGGYYASIDFADGVISHCIKELGGWQWLCSQQMEEMPFIEKRFMDLYRLMLKRGVKDNVRVIGFVEANNDKKGYLKHIPDSIKIGYKQEPLTKIADLLTKGG